MMAAFADLFLVGGRDRWLRVYNIAHRECAAHSWPSFPPKLWHRGAQDQGLEPEQRETRRRRFPRVRFVLRVSVSGTGHLSQLRPKHRV